MDTLWCPGLWDAKGRGNVIGPLLTISLFQTAINTAIFNAWMVQDLIPKPPSRSAIVIDNLGFHKGTDMQKALQIDGHTLLCLTPYSADLNPTQKKWADP